MGIFLPYLIKAQAFDSTECDKYFKRLNNNEIITYWASHPLLKKNSVPILRNLCDIILRDSCKRLIAALILDIKGNPVCIKFFPEISNDSLKNEIVKLLYQLEFAPATIGNNLPVISHYLLVINDEKCKNVCTAHSARKNKKKFKYVDKDGKTP